MNILMIRKDCSYPSGRYINQENNGEVDDVYVRNVAGGAALIKSGLASLLFAGEVSFCFAFCGEGWLG